VRNVSAESASAVGSVAQQGDLLTASPSGVTRTLHGGL
jgi:hypothetical protein